MSDLIRGLIALAIGGLLAVPCRPVQDEPPALDPFGPREEARDDAGPGYLELSDGTVHPGLLYLTRDHRLKIYDDKEERQRQVPLRAVRRIDCSVVKEWLEKEWRFQENASDMKVYTGRSYPVREYIHTITLTTGRTIRGPLSAIVYVQADGAADAEKFLLHKSDKGDPGTELRSLVYVHTIRLGPEALGEGKRKAKPPARGR
jgi:hypothetical protein